MTVAPRLALLTVAEAIDGLSDTLSSLRAQTDGRWRWCLAVAGPADGDVLTAVRDLIAGEPRAIAVAVPGADPGVAAASALDLAAAPYVAWLDSGDRIDAQTVAVVDARMADQPWLYTDEGFLDADGAVAELWFKPDFAPEWLRSQPYAVRLAVLRLDEVRLLGGIRPFAGTAAWYDLVLRVADRMGPGAHVAGPYYLRTRRGDGPPWVVERAADRCRVVGAATRPDDGVVEVLPLTVAGHPVGQRVRRIPGRRPRVSIVIPTRCSSSIIYGFPRLHAVELVRDLCGPDAYPDLEVVIVHDTVSPPEALAEIRRLTGERAVLVPYAGEFDFSRKCNAGALAASGEYLCFLNDDVEPITPDWLDEMVSLLADPGVGAVGARLLFADGTLQHAGHEYDGGLAHHWMFRRTVDDLDRSGSTAITSERSGVTAACMLLRADDFLQVGGFSHEFPISYNDVDLSLKIRAGGLRILYTPHATLRHFESQTRAAVLTEQEINRIRWRWRFALHTDPYINELERAPIAGPSLEV
jgi:GT2 family glycosyltransferase